MDLQLYRNLRAPTVAQRIGRGAPSLVRQLAGADPTTRSYVAAAQQNQNLSRMLAAQQAQIEAMQRHIFLDAGETVRSANVDAGLSSYATPDANGKGGIIWFPVATIIEDAVAGTQVEVAVTGLNHAKLTSTSIREVQFVLSGGLADLTQAAKVVASLKLNGITNNRLNRAPLDLAPGPGGVIVASMPIPGGIFIPPDSYVSIEYEVVTTLATDSDAQVEMRVFAGE